jgi:hypothetical protein
MDLEWRAVPWPATRLVDVAASVTMGIDRACDLVVGGADRNVLVVGGADRAVLIVGGAGRGVLSVGEAGQWCFDCRRSRTLVSWSSANPIHLAREGQRPLKLREFRARRTAPSESRPHGFMIGTWRRSVLSQPDFDSAECR